MSSFSTPATPCVPTLNVFSEMKRLRDDLDFYDREVVRLEGKLATTGSPAYRIALAATRAARSSTRQAFQTWSRQYH